MIFLGKKFRVLINIYYTKNFESEMFISDLFLLPEQLQNLYKIIDKSLKEIIEKIKTYWLIVNSKC